LIAVFFLFSQPLADDVVAFPTDVHVADRIPLEAAPPRLTQEFVPVAGLIHAADLWNQGHQICVEVRGGPLLLQELLDRRFNDVLLTAVEAFIL